MEKKEQCLGGAEFEKSTSRGRGGTAGGNHKKGRSERLLEGELKREPETNPRKTAKGAGIRVRVVDRGKMGGGGVFARGKNPSLKKNWGQEGKIFRRGG